MRDNPISSARFSDTFSDLTQMDFIARQVMNRIATVTLVQVKSVGSGTVNVQPMVAQIDGAGNAVDHGVINNVPFFTHRAGGSAIVITPKVGDIGAALFCHNDISSVKKNKAPSNPGSRRRYDWADALYLGGFLGGEASQTITIDDDAGIAITAADGKPIALTSSDQVAVAGPVATDTEYRVNGVKVIGSQQGAISDPTGGSTVDSASRTAIGQILSALRAHGLIA